jgi:PAS domain S-box-containing protein
MYREREQMEQLKRDIEEPNRAEKARQESEKHLRVKLDNILSFDEEQGKFSLLDLIDLEDLQQIQDSFAEAMEVASIISDVNGNPITAPSNFCGVCEIIRRTEKGNRCCIRSDKILGEKARKSMRPIFGECHSCGFVDASAPIIVGGKHIANWLIGQSNVMGVNRERIEKYAAEIGADADAMVEAYERMPQMSLEKFKQILNLLWLLAEKISTLGYNNLKLNKDIIERKQAEEALRESENRYRAVVEDMPAMICRFLQDGTLTFVNSSYCHYFDKKKEKLIGQNFFQFIPEDDQGKVKKHFLSFDQKSPMITYEHQAIAPDGKIRWQRWTDRALFDEQGNVVEYQSIGMDITEEKLAQEEKAKLEKQLQHAERMKAIGTLAGGIAHDFNNILFPIFGYTEMTMADVPENSFAYKNLNEILKAADRAKDLVKQILTFSRQESRRQKPILIQPIIKEALKLLRASIPTTIDFIQKIDKDCGAIMGDPTQIHQLMINLCTNAYHAMEDTGGKLEVNLTEVDIETDDIIEETIIKSGRYLRLTLSDTGHGIKRDVIERIFDPYYTTKEQNKGTGLGLSIVHGIVKNHGGYIKVYCEPGTGTAFNVYLPLIEMGPKAPKTAFKSDKSIPTGRERILLVDDEHQIVEMGQQMLERLGYHVTARTSSVEALEAFRNQPEKFDLIITDMTMPDMSGDILAKEIMRTRPDIPIIICTGFSERMTEEKIRALGIKEVVLKPVLMKEIARIIRNALAGN